MSFNSMNSLDTVEMVMAIEGVFGNIFEDSDFGFPPPPSRTPRELVDKLERRLSNQRPNELAAALLLEIARKQQRPEISEGMKGCGDEIKLPPSSDIFSRTKRISSNSCVKIVVIRKVLRFAPVPRSNSFVTSSAWSAGAILAGRYLCPKPRNANSAAPA